MAYITSGRIVSTGNRTYLPLPYGVDKFEIINATTRAAAGAGTGVGFTWQRGMAAGTAFEDVKLAADNSLSPVVIATGGFTEYNSSDDPLGAVQATAAVAGGPAIPSVTSVAHGLVSGDVIRMVNMQGATQLSGMDFTVTRTGNNTFDLTNMPAIVATALPGQFRLVKYAPLFYPANRYITKAAAIGGTTSTLITFSVTHDYVVGQELYFVVPAAFGMTQLNGLHGIVTAVGVADADGATNTVVVNIDSTAFTAFAFPLTGVEFTPAQAIPVGKDGQLVYAAANVSKVNTGTFGLILEGGINSPAGTAGDVLYWTAYKSDNL